jgi:ABC-type transport system substrate-binding protein
MSISETFSFLVEALRKEGLVFENKIYPTILEQLDEYYHKHENDVMFGGSSVHLSDPDGMYHVLGKHGAITSPMIQREKVTQLFESGRNLLDQSEIVQHYEQAAEAVLEEVPAVHLGFISHSYLYRSDRLEVDQKYLERHFDQFGKVFHLR